MGEIRAWNSGGRDITGPVRGGDAEGPVVRGVVDVVVPLDPGPEFADVGPDATVWTGAAARQAVSRRIISHAARRPRRPDRSICSTQHLVRLRAGRHKGRVLEDAEWPPRGLWQHPRRLQPLANILKARFGASVVGLALAAAMSPAVLPATPAAAEPAPVGPRTVAHDVVVDLAAAMPSGGVERLASGSFRTTTLVASKPVTACPGFWFTALGVVWHQHGRGAANGEVEWLDANDVVLGRAPLDTDDDAPAEPGLRSTDLVWTGGGDCARFTLRFPAGVTISNAHVAFVNTSGTAAGPGTGPPDTAPAPSGGASAAVSGGGPPMPGMVSRASWGAPPAEFNTGSPGCSAPYYSPVKVAYIHHTSGSNSYSRAQSDDIVRGDDWYHTQERGYCDIAYDFLVDRFGTIYVGRAGGADLPVIPGSQAGFNPYTTSVSVMGNFATVAPPTAAIASVERLLAWKLDVAHVPADGTTTLVSQGYDTDRYPPGQRITMHTIEGHRRTSQTDCPGRIWDLLPQIRRTVAAMGGPKIYRPTESAMRAIPGGTKPVSFAATATDPMRWTVTIQTQGGATIRALAQNGTSKTLHLSWDGLDPNGDPAPAGKYVAVIGGTTSGGTAPRFATLQVDVTGPPPAALPVPSGTVQVTSGFAELRAAAATGPTDVWTVGTLSNNGAVRPLVRHLGTHGWKSVSGPNPGIHGSGLQAVDALAPDDAWAGGFSCLSAACGPNGGFGSRTLMEHWDGSSWTAVPTPSPGTALNEIRAVDAVAPDDVWAAGLWSDRDRWLRHGLVLHWDGTAWRQVPIPFLNGETHLDGISASAPDDAWAVGESCPGPCSGLAHSTAVLLHWDGEKFSRVKPAVIGSDRSGLDGILAVSPTEAWAVGGRSANRIAPTHPLAERWDGHSWRLVDTPVVGRSSHWFELIPVPGAGLWSVGGFSMQNVERPLVVRRNTNGTWRHVPAPGPNVHLAFLSGVAAVSKTDVWAVGPATSGPFALHWNGHAWSMVATA
ncbi:MAG TPA: N-acetylmuramoyl-L-alanine amidase [Actinomycetota bacterium]|nr:N-acetylmuramoyl-L-alanine amidase [Actinomycetota bacterium]